MRNGWPRFGLLEVSHIFGGAGVGSELYRSLGVSGYLIRLGGPVVIISAVYGVLGHASDDHTAAPYSELLLMDIFYMCFYALFQVHTEGAGGALRRSVVILYLFIFGKSRLRGASFRIRTEMIILWVRREVGEGLFAGQLTALISRCESMVDM
jgi:hypothetical protein